MRPRDIRVLAVDDERATVHYLGRLLRRQGYVVETSTRGDQVQPLIREFDPHVLLLDLEMPPPDGITILKELKVQPDSPEVIIVTGKGSTEQVVTTMRFGAYWFLDKPIEPPETLFELIQRAAEKRFLSTRILDQKVSSQLVGQSQKMKALRSLVAKVARDKATVFITGQSGTGKELVARAIHDLSRRNGRAFVPVNCGAIPANLAERELFGHTKGSFTGATDTRPGYFQQADNGTLFLDEVMELPLELQSKLLRVLETGRVRSVGATRDVPVNVRVVTATNRDPMVMVDQGLFREDLLHRLQVFPIELPPLSERREDIPELANHLLRRCLASEERQHKTIERFTPEAIYLLQRNNWRGNVRELLNVIERAVVICDGPEIGSSSLPRELQRGATPTTWAQWHEQTLADMNQEQLSDYLKHIEKRWLAAVLRKNGWSVNRTAAALGTDASNFRKKMRRFGVRRPDSEG